MHMRTLAMPPPLLLSLLLCDVRASAFTLIIFIKQKHACARSAAAVKSKQSEQVHIYMAAAAAKAIFMVLVVAGGFLGGGLA